MSPAQQTDPQAAAAAAGTRRAGPGAGRAAVAVGAAASALRPGDRLFAPHGWLTASGLGPQSPPALAVGAALAQTLGPGARPQGAALALVDRHWADRPSCEAALALARRLALPVVVVAVDRSRRAVRHGEAIDRDDPGAVAAAIAQALEAARKSRRPAILECAALARPRAADPAGQVLLGGERWR